MIGNKYKVGIKFSESNINVFSLRIFVESLDRFIDKMKKWDICGFNRFLEFKFL